MRVSSRMNPRAADIPVNARRTSTVPRLERSSINPHRSPGAMQTSSRTPSVICPCQTPAASKPQISPSATAMPPTRGVGLLWTLRRLRGLSSTPRCRPHAPPASSRAPTHAERAAISTVIAIAMPGTPSLPPAIRLVVVLAVFLLRFAPLPGRASGGIWASRTPLRTLRSLAYLAPREICQYRARVIYASWESVSRQVIAELDVFGDHKLRRPLALPPRPFPPPRRGRGDQDVILACAGKGLAPCERKAAHVRRIADHENAFPAARVGQGEGIAGLIAGVGRVLVVEDRGGRHTRLDQVFRAPGEICAPRVARGILDSGKQNPRRIAAPVQVERGHDAIAHVSAQGDDAVGGLCNPCRSR